MSLDVTTLHNLLTYLNDTKDFTLSQAPQVLQDMVQQAHIACISSLIVWISLFGGLSLAVANLKPIIHHTSSIPFFLFNLSLVGFVLFTILTIRDTWRSAQAMTAPQTYLITHIQQLIQDTK